MEIWKDCFGKFKGSYQVSNLGAVRSIDRKVVSSNGKTLYYRGVLISTKAKDNKGYYQVYLSISGRQHTVKIHRLVALAFLGNRDGRFVDHIDGDKSNNRLSNLEYVTPRENCLRAVRSNFYGKGRTYPSIPKKINLAIAEKIRDRVRRGERRALLAAEYNIHVMTVGEIVRHEIWRVDEKN